jgi:hypothetical protein
MVTSKEQSGNGPGHAMLIESNRVNKGLRNVKSARLFIRSAWPSGKKRGNLQNIATALQRN